MTVGISAELFATTPKPGAIVTMSTFSKPPAKRKTAVPPPAPVARKSGRPAYMANDRDRTMVRLLCAGGITQDRIAVAIGISEPTLRRHFARDIKVGQTEIDAQAVGTLVAAMRAGGKEGVAAAKFWCESRMGWSERITVDNGKLANTPMRVIIELVGDAAPPQVEQLVPRTASLFLDDMRKHVQLVG